MPLVLAAFIVLVVAMTAMRNYIKVPPNKVAVFHGRRHKSPDGKAVGFRLVTGGAAFRWPIVESVTYLDLTIFPIDLDVRDVPNKDGVLASVQAVANVKIRSDHQSLVAAAERFLGRSPEEIKQIAYKNLEGHLRSIVGRLTMEEIVRDRAKFNQEVLNEAASDLAKTGLGVDVLTIQRVADPEGYIEALGKKRTAEVKRDAQIGEALAAPLARRCNGSRRPCRRPCFSSSRPPSPWGSTSRRCSGGWRGRSPRERLPQRPGRCRTPPRRRTGPSRRPPTPHPRWPTPWTG